MFYQTATICRVMPLALLLGAYLPSLSPAHASVTLERVTFNSLQHGQIVGDSDPSNGLTLGSVLVNNDGSNGSAGMNAVTISGDNQHDSRDWIVAFDTFAGGTRDGDLEDPFDFGNAALHTQNGVVVHRDLINTQQAGGFPNHSRFQDALIIQEVGVGEDLNGDGLLDNGSVRPADDEGRRPAGSIIFDFESPISQIGFDLLDVEGPEEFNDGGYVATFLNGNGTELARVGFGDFTDSSSRFYDPTVRFGNNSANRIDPITVEDLRLLTGDNSIDDFTRVVIRFGGSGAIDNLSFSTATTPEATALVTWFLLGCCAGYSRKRA